MTIKMSICYENTSDLSFDQEYYLNQHIPLARTAFEPHGLLYIDVYFPLPSANGEQPKYRAITEIYFTDLKTATTCLNEAGKAVMKDVKNYTNSEPVHFISEAIMKC
ncbi:hypothetical protein CS022_13955 [Veronia nyctiphanis]|uniref:EthD domain-containing protein n=1 Tax=Veronia nyctiphanis TaxID=1278244 RepID=A0A4Q0YQ97_9GAMM|nr:EthD family reductase [Veronia nyctiphanis]RXJ72735.1 hypothetical protein CS022_13955 [Veronia nyctiphanis]